MFQFRNFQLEPPLNVHCGMPAWKMNHLGQTGLAGTHLVQTLNRVGPRSGHGQTGLAGTHPVHFLCHLQCFSIFNITITSPRLSNSQLHTHKLNY